MTDRTVLLVDDDPMILQAQKAVLPEQLGVKILEARDGFEAVDQLLAQPVDVVVLDVQMPRMTGFEVLSFIHHHPSTRKIPVIIMTSLRGAGIRERAGKLGVQAVLSKPVDAAELINAVRVALPR